MTAPKVELPEGLQSYYERIGAYALQWTKVVITEEHGKYYNEKVVIRIGDDGTVKLPEGASADYLPTPDEQAAIKAEWPTYTKRLPTQRTASVSEAFDFTRTGEDRTFFIIWKREADCSESRTVLMIQERIVADRRRFIPWTMWSHGNSSGNWYQYEPAGGLLPFWKPRKPRLKRVMVHEGAKSAEAAERIVTDAMVDHPWKEELSKWEHWGILGGAIMAHQKADWSELRAWATEGLAYACDNDEPGREILKHVSRAWGSTLKGVLYPRNWPDGWDVADPIPPGSDPEAPYFHKGRYVGPMPSFRPATFATVLDNKDPNKPKQRINKAFAEEYFYHYTSPRVACHKDTPNNLRTEDEFNDDVAPYSDVEDTFRFLKKIVARKATGLSYEPNQPPGLVDGENKDVLNTHVPSKIKPVKGDAQPWEEFREHLFPDPNDRRQMDRWMTTLITRPGTKMTYGVLLFSEMQGIGKSFLGVEILTPPVGRKERL